MTTGPNRDLLSGPIGRTLLLFALPTLASSALQSASGSLNTLWVGRFLGEEALAATANGNIVMFLLVAFVFGFGMASTIYVGQAWGRGDADEARRVAGTAVGAFVPVAALVAAGGWFGAPWLLDVLGTPESVVPLALAYLRVVFLSMPAMLMFTLLTMALRGTGDSTTPLWFIGASVVIDSGLNPLLILGLGPLPELGIAGAGLATAIAQYVSLAAMLAWIYARDLPLRLRGAELRYLVPDLARLRTILAKGLPMGLQMIVISSAALSMLTLINREGVDTTAAYSVVQQLWGYVQMPAMALGAAVSAMAAQAIGAERWDRVDRIARDGVIQNVLLTGTLVLVLMLLSRPALTLFLGEASAALPIAEHVVHVSTWGFVAFGVALVLFGTVRANGQVIGPLVILTVAMYPVRLGFALGAREWLGVDAIWWSFPVALVATMGMAFALYRFGGWRYGHLLPLSHHECESHARCARETTGALAPAG